ncbi:MAG: DUF3127 domain-containing protein [Cryomorphaceae bacterium]
MSMEVEGSIKVVFDTQTFNSGFQKKEFVITTKEQYPQDVKFELIKERIDLIDPYSEGDNIKVHFNLRGNEYNGKYFVNLQAWRIEPVGSSQAAAGGTASADPFADAGFPETPNADTSSEDDLPF